jgi:hypothetical protein
MACLIDIVMQSKFSPNPHWGDIVNHNVALSEIEGGVDLRQAPPETVLEVRTQNHVYTIIHKGEGEALISGHPQYCPRPTLVKIHGSTWGGAMLKQAYIGRGMRLEFRREDDEPITTSPVVEIVERAA